MTLTAESQSFRANGVDLVWHDDGHGPTGTPALVLVHGFTGSSHDFSLQVDALAADRRVITLDQRGHGRSTRTGVLEGYDIEQLVADLVAFLEAMGGGPVDLLGHSMGGRVALGTVVARPDLVSSLVLMDTSAWSFLPPDDAIRAMVSKYITEFDPSQGMPATLSFGGPEDTLIEAAVPASWQKEKDAIFAGMDAYAVKAFGMALMADMPTGDSSLPRRSAVHHLPDDGHRGRARPPVGGPGARAGGRSGARPAHGHRGRVPLAAADPRRSLAGCARDPPGVGGR